jgi:hypothetical protein
MRVIVIVATLVVVLASVSGAQVGIEAQREGSRLERLAGNMWEGMLDDMSFGYSWDRGELLDVFNFANGARHLNLKLKSSQVQPSEVRDVIEMLLLQARAVDGTMRGGKAGRWLLGEWEETKKALDVVADRWLPQRARQAAREAPAAKQNVNELKIEIKDIRRTGNFFGNDYRIHGVIYGRNLVAAGFYHQGQLLKPISVRLNERRYTENPFELRIEMPDNPVTVRVIDSEGFVLEQAVEISSGGLLPGLR